MLCLRHHYGMAVAKRISHHFWDLPASGDADLVIWGVTLRKVGCLSSSSQAAEKDTLLAVHQVTGGETAALTTYGPTRLSPQALLSELLFSTRIVPVFIIHQFLDT